MKKNRDKFFVRWKKIREKYWSGKRKSGENFIGEKFSPLQKTFPRLFSPDKVVCSEIHFGGDSCCVETGQLACVAGKLTSFFMMLSFGDGNFRTDYNICSELPFVGGYCHEENSRLVWVVNRFLYGMDFNWEFSTNRYFLIVRISFTYWCCLSLGLFNVFGDVGYICGLQLWRSLLFLLKKTLVIAAKN